MKPQHSFYVFLIAFVAAIGGFLFGYDLAIIAGANIYLREQFHLTDMEFGFTTASAVLGCIAGPLWGGWFCDRVGRKPSLIVASLLLAISAIFTALADTVVTLNIFRFVGGIGVGICSIASPMYIVEVAPIRIRGAMGVMYQLAIVVGSICAALAAYWCATTLSDAVCWRWMFVSEMLFIVLFVMFVFFLPRSPRWLGQKNRYDEALTVLSRINGLQQGELELASIRTSLAGETGRWSELLKPNFRKALIVGLLLAFFNNWTGWSGMSGYLPYLFEKSGVTSRTEAILQYAISYGVMGVLTMAACWIVDRAGRRKLWIFSSIVMVIATAGIGAVFYFNIQGYIVLLFVSLCAVPHALALGPLPWLMMSEIFPNRLRAKAVGITTTFLWTMIFLVGLLFPIISGVSERLIGSPAGIFWLFSLICLSAIFFGWKILPETKGKSLEEITASMEKTK